MVERRYELPPAGKRLIAQEIISGFQGKSQAVNIRFRKNGSVVYSKGSLYPAGIKRAKSPNGNRYEPLADKTIAIKRKKGAKHPTWPLVFTEELLNGLKYRVTSQGVQVSFKNSEVARKSLKMETGGSFLSYGFGDETGKRYKANTPARPHRDIQPRVARKIQTIIRAWLRASS